MTTTPAHNSFRQSYFYTVAGYKNKKHGKYELTSLAARLLVLLNPTHPPPRAPLAHLSLPSNISSSQTKHWRMVEMAMEKMFMNMLPTK